jgi:CRP/FNR family cyclic AMP-dependent transcriptional regulator
MAHEQLPQMLANIDLLAGIPKPVIEDLIEAGSIFMTPPGRTVVMQGSPDAGLQVILEGTANVEVGGASRGKMGPGSYFGEISVIDGAGRSATITAGDEGLKTFTISPLNFMQLVDRHPPLARALLKALCARVRALERPTDRH